MSVNLLIAGGGTGGHLFPGVAVAGRLMEMHPDLAVSFVATGRDLERRVLAQAGFPLQVLKARPLAGSGLLGRVKALAVLPGSILKAVGLIRRFRPAMVLAVGGYAAFPLGVAAWLCRVPLAVQEQNAAPGLTNRSLGRFADQVFCAFGPCRDHFDPAKVRVLGNPVRPEIIEQAAGAQRPNPAERFNLLILGGSQGAASLNRAMLAALPLLAEYRERLFITHQAGSAMAEEVAAGYREAGFAAEAAAFFQNVGELYGRAHLVVSRAGAGAVSELAVTGRPSILVPYPFAAGDHQTINAAHMVEAGAARLVGDSSLSGELLAGLLTELMNNENKRGQMESAAAGQARPHAADDIARDCLALMKEAA